MKIKKSANILFLTLLLFAGCDDNFLNVQPPDSLTEDTFFQTIDDAEAAVTTVYHALLNIGHNNSYARIIQATLNDITPFNLQGLWVDSWSIATTDPFVDEVWQGLYEGVFRANIALQKLPDIDIDESKKNRLLGEVYFLRALYYWHLSTLFGEVPLMTEADPLDISKAMLPKSSVDDIYDLMIADLEMAIERLPLQSEYGSNDIGRATRGAAEALLGKVYLYDGNYVNAEILLGDVIASGEYQLIDDFADLMILDNNPESIFEVQLEDLPGQGSSRIRNDYPQGQGGFANHLPTQDMVDAFENHTGPSAINGRDPRLFYSIFREGDPYDDVESVFQQAWTPTGYAQKKAQYPVIRFNNANLGRNFPLIRLADVLLMYAEVANELGMLDEARDALNQVRQRPSVEMPPRTVAETANQRDMFEAIVHERRVELAFEYHRLNDLRRWGLAEQVLGPNGYTSPRHRYFPIPQAEIDNNPNLVQNPNY